MSKKKYDPTIPRLNPEIKEILSLIRKNSTELIKETNFITRRGQALILIAHLEELIDQPEYFIDVEEGLIDNDNYYIKPESFSDGQVKFLPQKPFDSLDISQDYFFFFSNQKISYLYQDKPLDPYYCRSSDFGLITYTLQKIYCTANKTQVHINDYQVFTNCLNDIKSSNKQTFTEGNHRYFILADPQGLNYQQPLVITKLNSLEEAIFITKKMTEYLDIRFLVAKQIYMFDSH